MKKRILVVCGTGIATSTVVTQKLKKHLEQKNVDAYIEQAKVLEVGSKAEQFDLIVATTPISTSVKTPVVNAVALLTGIGVEEVFKQIDKALELTS